MTVLGFENKSGQPNNFPLPEDLHDQSKLSKQQYLHKAAGQIVDKLVFTHSSIEKQFLIVFLFKTTVTRDFFADFLAVYKHLSMMERAEEHMK